MATSERLQEHVALEDGHVVFLLASDEKSAQSYVESLPRRFNLKYTVDEEKLIVPPATHGAHDAPHAPPIGASTQNPSVGQTTVAETVLAAHDTNSQKGRRALADAIVAIYDEGFRPPKWAVDCYVDEFDEYAKHSRLFVDAGARHDEAVSLAKLREPVNIKFERLYAKDELRESFGYTESGYQTYFNKNKKLAPNIGVLTKAKVRTERPKTRKHPKAYDDADVWIYHAVGAALDSVSQPDYLFYVKDKEPADVEAGLLAFYKSVFAKIFAAARSIKVGGIVMSLVGADAFAALYPGGPSAMHNEVWIPAFEAARALGANTGIQIRVIGKNLKSTPAGKHMIDSYGMAGKGEYPNFLFGDAVWRSWMIVSAWDCHSLPGNGNFSDGSLDGFVGRSSAVHFFGWGIANPFLVKESNVRAVEMV
jgi:hypothetical protein